MIKKILVTGVFGQTGSFLAEECLKQDYIVYGIAKRKTSKLESWNEKLLTAKNFHLITGDITDSTFLTNTLNEIKPNYIANLAAQSHVKYSFSTPILTLSTNLIAPSIILEWIRASAQECRFYNASTSEIFGGKSCPILGFNENSPIIPKSPYGVSKAGIHNMIKIYRESYDLFLSNGILFNHESERRPKDFVTQKIIHNMIRISKGEIETFELGNLAAVRDWGYAADYAGAILKILEGDKPSDYVIATGAGSTVDNFAKLTAEALGIKNYKDKIKINMDLYRPLEVDYLIGDPSKAKWELGWKATTSLESLIDIMIKAGLADAC